MKEQGLVPLLDGDLLCYEIGFAAESGWVRRVSNEEAIPPWDYVQEVLSNRIEHICFNTKATSPPILFFTGKTNFRDSIARTKPYKGNRDCLHKPWHYYNIRAFLQGNYSFRLQEGLEADDLISLELISNPDTTISCTRDKDLRQVPGWHYSWELGDQPSWGPFKVEGYGEIELQKNGKKLFGWGDKWFLAQCLIGDTVDNIPGLPKCGPVKAYSILGNTKTYTEGLEAVREAYRGFYGDSGDSMFLEQGRLLWMTRKLNVDGSPTIWEINA